MNLPSIHDEGHFQVTRELADRIRTPTVSFAEKAIAALALPIFAVLEALFFGLRYAAVGIYNLVEYCQTKSTQPNSSALETSDRGYNLID